MSFMDVLHSGASSYLTHTLGAPKRWLNTGF